MIFRRGSELNLRGISEIRVQRHYIEHLLALIIQHCGEVVNCVGRSFFEDGLHLSADRVIRQEVVVFTSNERAGVLE